MDNFDAAGVTFLNCQTTKMEAQQEAYWHPFNLKSRRGAKKGLENIRMITDVFRKFYVAVATKDQKATTVTRALVDRWFIYFDVPRRIDSNQG